MKLTSRDQAVIHSLLFCVRLATLDQLARTWWSPSATGRKNAGNRVTSLLRSGWLSTRSVLARPLLPLIAPEQIWNPGDPAPDFGALAWRLQSRWKQPVQLVRACLASPAAARRLGGPRRGRIKNLCQVTHDLHVSEIYLKRVRHEPALAQTWVGEDVLAPQRRHQKLPDAVLQTSTGEIFRVIEFGGCYSATRVAQFHADCAARRLPYELW